MDLVIPLHLLQEGDFPHLLREAFDKKEIDMHPSGRLYHLYIVYCIYCLVGR